jgi:myo-inositol 2-dehydrogenase/D-chiro-inositol 1-dehydrogenase
MIQVGLLGAGRIGKVHATSLVTQIQAAKIHTVVDYVEQAAAGLAQTWGISNYSSDHRDVIDNPDIDAVVIASSTDTHAQFIIEAAQAGKHIFCEKPIDFDLNRIDEALAAVEAAGVKLQIGFNKRFDVNPLRLKRAIESGEIGTPHLLHIVSRDPAPPPISYIEVSGGLYFDMTIHDFDMARFLYGDVVEVYATGGVMVDPAIGEAGDIDTAIITLKFANGALGTIDNSRQSNYGYDQRIEIFGSNGSASAGNFHENNVVVSNPDGVRRDQPLDFFLERYTPAYVAEMAAFIDAVVNDTPVPVTGADGRAPVVIAMAAKRSLEENRPVKLSEISA